MNCWSRRFPTYFINGEKEILSAKEIEHFNYPLHKLERTMDWLPSKRPLTIILTSGASCPDTLLDRVMLKVLGMVEEVKDPMEVVDGLIR